MTLKANPTEIKICNLALLAVGRDKITDFNGNTAEEVLVEAFYPFARDSLLEQAPWSFAKKRVKNLPPLATDPDMWEWTYAFQQPADCLRVWEIENALTTDWAVEEDQIRCKLDSINIMYIKRIEDTSRFSATFIIALSKWLESMIAIPTTGKTTRRDQALKEAQFYIQEAASMNGQQGTPNQPLALDLETVRD